MLKKCRAYRYRGTLALIVVTAVVTAGLLSSCGDDGTYATTPAKLVVNGSDVNVPFIATINGKEVSLDEYRYHFLSTKYSMDNGDETYWDDDADGSKLRRLKLEALHAMEETYAVEALAEDLNLSLTNDERSQIESDVKNQISTLGGSEEYTKALSENYLTDQLYRYLWQTNFYCEKLWAYYFSPGGPNYNANEDSGMTDDQLEESYQITFKAIVAEAVDKLNVELASEYNLITVDSLQ